MFPIFLYCTSRHNQKVFYNFLRHGTQKLHKWEFIVFYSKKNNFCIIINVNNFIDSVILPLV